MARQPICDNNERIIGFKFRPNLVYDELSKRSGNNKSAYIRNLIEKAEIPHFEFLQTMREINVLGRDIAKTGKIFDKANSDYLSVKDMKINLSCMLEWAEKLLDIVLEFQKSLSGINLKEIDLTALNKNKSGLLCIRMAQSYHEKLNKIASIRRLSMSAVLRAMILEIQLPDESALKACKQIIRVSWLIKHIAGVWREKIGSNLQEPGLLEMTNTLYQKGQAVANVGIKITAIIMSQQYKTDHLRQEQSEAENDL